MNLTVNGTAMDFSVPLQVAELLAKLGLDAARVAVELNQEILPRDRFTDTALSEGDSLEIVQFVGGG